MKNNSLDNDLFTKKILSWGVTNYRDFPWRTSNDPYKILMTEILLQRTKAEQVNKIYESFFRKFPNINKLSESSIKEIENEIKTLGILHRANNISSISKLIVKEHDGKIPENSEALKKLPGIGNYTSGAFLTIYLNERVSVLDSNIVRFLSRFFNLELNDNSRKNKKFNKHMNGILPYNNNKDFLFSILDLTNSICTVRNPKCNLCPVNFNCFYNKNERKLVG